MGDRSSLPNGEEQRSVLSEKDIQWLNDLSDELQNVITETDWETAVDMLQQWKSCNCRDGSINAKFLALERQVGCGGNEEICLFVIKFSGSCKLIVYFIFLIQEKIVKIFKKI